MDVNNQFAGPQRVVITGMGLISPLGNSVESTWQGLINGKSGCGRITLFDTSNIEIKIACEVKGFDPNAYFTAKESRRMDRCAQLAVAAGKAALADANYVITDDNTYDTGIIMGSGIGGVNTLTNEHAIMMSKGPNRVSPFAVPMMLPDTATGQMSIHLKIKGPNFCVVSACASGTNAIGEAFELLRSGRASVVLAGGNEAPVNAFAISAFHNMGALSTSNDDPLHASRPFDAKRNGFVTGEGAGVLVMETLEHAKARGARIYAEILGYGVTNDAYHITAPDTIGPAVAMRIALKQAGSRADHIDYINAHGTSTSLNDSNETKAIKAVFGERAYGLTISSTKSMSGHLLGAAGAFEAIACVKAINESIVPPTINYDNPDPSCDLNYTPNVAVKKPVHVTMSNSFGFGGHNASIIISEYSE